MSNSAPLMHNTHPVHNNDNDEIVNPNSNNGHNLSNIIDRIIHEKINTSLKRRDFFKLSVSVTALSTIGCTSDKDSQSNSQETKFTFKEIKSGVDETIHVPKNYQANVLISWGQGLHKNVPEFNPYQQTLDGQLQRFGYNNDFLGYLPLPAGSNNPNHGILCVNHEYVYEPMMFAKPLGDNNHYSKEQTHIAQAACGNSIIEIIRDKTTNQWRFIQDSPFNRRINMYNTKIDITGPAAGHKRLKTSQDIAGQEITGTFQNCAGGITPWGTYLTCEENIDYAFGNYAKADSNNPEIKKSKRFGLGSHREGDWHLYDKRFDLSQEPNEINRFGWVVEIDAYDPHSKPRKHSALGRFKHENCFVTIDKKTQKAVAYMGDDQYFEYLYKFISDDIYIKDNKKHNMSLLTNGTLYVAKFNDDMSLEWLPLIYGQNGLTAENGFASQGDIVIDARYAADYVGATPLDRPEGIAMDPNNGDIYVSLTMNEKRANPNIANPRIKNEYGQIIHLKTMAHHSDTHCKWDILLLGGSKTAGGTGHQAGTTEDGTIACPDNLAFDHHGRLWVATDQGGNWGEKTGKSDGLYAVEHTGGNRGKSKLFFRSPVGAETTGICFTPDDKTLFLCVQHPGTDGCKAYEKFGKKSTFLNPATRWPNPETSNLPPYPSVVQITHKDNKII